MTRKGSRLYSSEIAMRAVLRCYGKVTRAVDELGEGGDERRSCSCASASWEPRLFFESAGAGTQSRRARCRRLVRKSNARSRASAAEGKWKSEPSPFAPFASQGSSPSRRVTTTTTRKIQHTAIRKDSNSPLPPAIHPIHTRNPSQTPDRGLLLLFAPRNPRAQFLPDLHPLKRQATPLPHLCQREATQTAHRARDAVDFGCGGGVGGEDEAFEEAVAL